MTTVAELIAIVRKPGKILMPILAANDVFDVAVEKADLLNILKNLDPRSLAPWKVAKTEEGFTYLDTQDTTGFPFGV